MTRQKHDMAQHQEDWNVYLCDLQSGRASITLDLGWGYEGPPKDKPVRIIVRLACRDQSRWGLPAAEELDTLTALEDQAIGALSQSKGVVSVGAIQTGDSRDSIFYAPAKHGITVRQLAAIPADRRAEPFLLIDDDPEWRLYLDVMFPSPDEHRRMMDEGVLRNLAESGDDHSIPRRVDHWIYFDDVADRPGFIAWCESNGYTTEQLIERDDDHDRAGVQIHHTSPVTPDVIHDTIASLVAAAEDAGGLYDGWETCVMKPT